MARPAFEWCITSCKACFLAARIEQFVIIYCRRKLQLRCVDIARERDYPVEICKLVSLTCCLLHPPDNNTENPRVILLIYGMQAELRVSLERLLMERISHV